MSPEAYSHALALSDAPLPDYFTVNPLWRLLAEAYPEHVWDISKFQFYATSARAFLARYRPSVLAVLARLGRAPSDLSAFYSESLPQGSTLPLSLFHSSLPRLLVTLFPEHVWDYRRLSRSNAVPRPGRFPNIASQRTFLIDMGKSLGISENEYSKWYSVTNSQVLAHGGGTLLSKKFGSSVSAMVTALFPEHKWDLHAFHMRPQRFWQEPAHQREAVERLGVKLGLATGTTL